MSMLHSMQYAYLASTSIDETVDHTIRLSDMAFPLNPPRAKGVIRQPNSVLLSYCSFGDLSGLHARQLLASSDPYMRTYRQHPDCQGKNVMVCKDCMSGGLEGIRLQTLDMPYQIWCFDSGDFFLEVPCCHLRNGAYHGLVSSGTN